MVKIPKFVEDFVVKNIGHKNYLKRNDGKWRKYVFEPVNCDGNWACAFRQFSHRLNMRVKF